LKRQVGQEFACSPSSHWTRQGRPITCPQGRMAMGPQVEEMSDGLIIGPERSRVVREEVQMEQVADVSR
jgi:hypothetical protein